VREAIRILEEKKVLRSRPGSGTFVIIENASSVVDIIADAIQREKNKLSEIFQFRRLIEPQIAGLAAENASRRDISAMEEIVERQKNALRNIHTSMEMDQAFHLALARASHNGILLQIVELLTGILGQSRDAFSQSLARRQLSLDGHMKIIEAVRDADAERAREAMDNHLKIIEEVVISR
jgi:GntR family transcriptional repressor for pyruvate dehydrogenase complex